jgi:hypothetical protein
VLHATVLQIEDVATVLQIELLHVIRTIFRRISSGGNGFVFIGGCLSINYLIVLAQIFIEVNLLND